MSNANGLPRPKSLLHTRLGNTKRHCTPHHNVAVPDHLSPPGGQGRRGSADGKSETEGSVTSSSGSDVSALGHHAVVESLARCKLDAEPGPSKLREEPRVNVLNHTLLAGCPMEPHDNVSFVTPMRREKATERLGNSVASHPAASRDNDATLCQVGTVHPRFYVRPQGMEISALPHGGGKVSSTSKDHLNRTLPSDTAVECMEDLKLIGSCGATGGGGDKELEHVADGHMQEQKTFFEDHNLETDDEWLGCKPLGSYEDVYLGAKVHTKTSLFSGVKMRHGSYHVDKALDVNLCHREDDTKADTFLARPKCPKPQSNASNPSALLSRAMVESNSLTAHATPPCKTQLPLSPVLNYSNPASTSSTMQYKTLCTARRLGQRTSTDNGGADKLPQDSPFADFAYNSYIKRDCLAIINELRRQNTEKQDFINCETSMPLWCPNCNEMTNSDISNVFEILPMRSLVLPQEMTEELNTDVQLSHSTTGVASEPPEAILLHNTMNLNNNSNQQSNLPSTKASFNNVSTAVPNLRCDILSDTFCVPMTLAASGCAAETVVVNKAPVNSTKTLLLANMDSTRIPVSSQIGKSLPAAAVENNVPNRKSPTFFKTLQKTGAEIGPHCTGDPERGQGGATSGSNISHSVPGDSTLKDKHSPNDPPDFQKTSLVDQTTSTPLVGDGCAKTLGPAVIFSGDHDLGEISTISSTSMTSLSGLTQQQQPPPPQKLNVSKRMLPAFNSRTVVSTTAKTSEKNTTAGRVTTDKAPNVKAPLKVVQKAWSLDVQHKLPKSMGRIPGTAVGGQTASAAAVNVQKYKRPVKTTDPTGCGDAATVNTQGALLPLKIKTSAIVQAKDNPAVALKTEGLPATSKRMLPSPLCRSKLGGVGATKYGSPLRPKSQASNGVEGKLPNTPSRPCSSNKVSTPVKATAGRSATVTSTPSRLRSASVCPHQDDVGPSSLGVTMMSPRLSLTNVTRSSPRTTKPPMSLASLGGQAARTLNKHQPSGLGDSHPVKEAPASGQVKATALKPWVGSKLKTAARPIAGGKAESATLKPAVGSGLIKKSATGCTQLPMVTAEKGRDSSKAATGYLPQPSNPSLRPTDPVVSGRSHAFLPRGRGMSRLPAAHATTVARPQQDNPNNVTMIAGAAPTTKAVATGSAAVKTTAAFSQRPFMRPPTLVLRKRSPSPGSASITSGRSTGSELGSDAAKHTQRAGGVHVTGDASSQVPAEQGVAGENTAELCTTVTGASRPANRPALTCCQSQPELLLARGHEERSVVWGPGDEPVPPGERISAGERSAAGERCAEQLLAQGATACAALATALQYMVVKNEKISGKLTELNLELKNVHQQLATHAETCTQLEQQKEAAERDAIAALAEAERRHAEALLSLEAALQQQFHAEMEQLQQVHEQELEAMRVAQQTGALQSEHELETVKALKDDVERSIDELNVSFEKERTFMRNTFECEKSSLEEKVKLLNMQIKDQNEEIARIEKRLKNTSASKGSPQSPVSSPPHMEDELNSLKAVVDIRTQQIRTLERRLLTLQQEADAKRVLEEKVQILQQQNEDMKARMDMSKEVTRQLSSEQMALQASLQREAKAKQRLSMEKEQLMWKLQNGGTPAVSPSSPSSSSTMFFSFQSNNTPFI